METQQLNNWSNIDCYMRHEIHINYAHKVNNIFKLDLRLINC
jgi:hypothetical protein